MNIETTFVDGTNTMNIAAAMRPNTKMIWLEGASNPKLKVVDIRDVVEQARCRNPDVLIVVSRWV